MPLTPKDVRGVKKSLPSAKCATVTMMLAERMTRHDRAVDDEHFFETNTMNVWQTLEFLSSVNLRKRYHYEGYNDARNSVRTLTPSWRRDSFIEKSAATPKPEDAATKYPAECEGSGSGTGSGDCGSGSTNQAADSEMHYNGKGGRAASRAGSGGSGVRFRADKSERRQKNRKKRDSEELDSEYALSPADYSDLIKCSFNLPRISACLERLMGTNIVRLTDRKYMKELRERINEDYRHSLLGRIKARELKEIERERLLIIDGKTAIIPQELAEDPIFIVDKIADMEIQKQRSKLKTNREKNAERLKQQGVKWERERLQHEEEERARIEKAKVRRKEQKEMEERYKEEDAERGMDLLRIENEDWRECEQKLKEFLETERAKMKTRSLKVPTPYSSDPQDIQNIVRARQKFRETERRIRQELEEKTKHSSLAKTSAESKLAKSTITRDLLPKHASGSHLDELKELTEFDFNYIVQEGQFLQGKYSDDISDISEEEVQEESSTISESNRRHAYQLGEEMENDVQQGLLISKDQYDHLRYEEEKIIQLRNAKNIRELYSLAEEIIIGEPLIEDVVEEEAEEEALAEGIGSEGESEGD